MLNYMLLVFLNSSVTRLYLSVYRLIFIIKLSTHTCVLLLQFFRFRVHKACAEKAPHNCGLPRELIEYFRRQVVLTSALSPSNENFVSPSEGHSARPPLQKVSTVSEPDSGKENDQFVIHELSKEPSKSEFVVNYWRGKHDRDKLSSSISLSLSLSLSLNLNLNLTHSSIQSHYGCEETSPREWSSSLWASLTNLIDKPPGSAQPTPTQWLQKYKLQPLPLHFSTHLSQPHAKFTTLSKRVRGRGDDGRRQT